MPWYVKYGINADWLMHLHIPMTVFPIWSWFLSACCSYVTELAEQIKIKTPDEEEEDTQFVQFFPNFVWTVRDFILELKLEKKGEVTEDEYLEFALQLKHGIKSYYWNPRY